MGVVVTTTRLHTCASSFDNVYINYYYFFKVAWCACLRKEDSVARAYPLDNRRPTWATVSIIIYRTQCVTMCAILLYNTTMCRTAQLDIPRVAIIIIIIIILFTGPGPWEIRFHVTGVRVCIMRTLLRDSSDCRRCARRSAGRGQPVCTLSARYIPTDSVVLRDRSSVWVGTTKKLNQKQQIGLW